MIPRATIDQIMSVAMIEEVIGDFVQLKKSGSSYKGLSPFTNEKTPSFYVSPAKGIFKCFSSGKGGNAVTFLMEHEKLSYPEALRWLADKYNIEIEEEKPNEEEMQERSERESLLAVSSYAAKFFEEYMWNHEEGQAIGLSYFQERGFRDDIIKLFKLGFCPDGWTGFSDEAQKAGYELKWMKAAGLVKESKDKHFDFFKGRVMFPIRDISGRVIAFGGRTLKTDKKIAKYFNSPESALYIKSKVLYGIYEAKNSIVKKDRCYLVEGYTDVISMHQSGVDNVVASSGTSLTDDQVRLIKRYTQNITILYDGDPAGIRASFRGINLILAQGLNVKVVLFPDGDDPDSYAKKVSSEILQNYIEEEAKDFLEFKTSMLAEDAAGDPIKRAEMIREVVDSIAHIPDGIKRAVYIQECSRLLAIEEQVLLNETNKILRQENKKQAKRNEFRNEQRNDIPPPPPPPPLEEGPHQERKRKLETSALSQEKDLIRLLLTFGRHPIKVELHRLEDDEKETLDSSVAEYLLFELQDEQLELHDEVMRKIVVEYARFLQKGEFPPEKYFQHHESASIHTLCADLMAFPYELSGNWSERHQIYPETEDMNLAKATKDCVFRLKLRHVLVMIEELQIEIKSCAEEEKLFELIKEKQHLDAVKRDLSRYFGSAIV
ncbi:MAG: DNA primase [Flavobacteriales bacterium]|nr:DNA primase [Flavobacteriales bacterium]